MKVSIKAKIITLVLLLVLFSILIVGAYISHIKIEQLSDPVSTSSLLLGKEVIIVVLSTFIVAVIVTFIFSYTLVKPVDNLIIGTQLLAEGKLDYKIKKYSDDEIGRLVDSFNDMIAKLKISIEKETLSSEAALLERNKAELIIDSMADCVIVTDEDDKIVLFNPASEDLFELNKEKVLNKHILHYMKRFGFTDTLSDNKKIKHLKINPNKVTVSEFKIEKPSKKILRTTFAPLKNKKAKRLGTVIVFQDVTKLKEVEEMKNDFVSIVSHELKTPLTSIKGYASLLNDGTLGELTDKQKRAVSIIDTDSDRLTSLIEDILDLSKLESGKIKTNFELINIEECIENSPAIGMIEKKGIKFNKYLPKEMPLVYADKNKINQVFTNLLGNAAKFTKQNGEISVHIKDKKEFIKIDIKDTGVGIPKKLIPHLFNKFYQVDNHLRRGQGGSGLGLPIVKEILGLHNSLIAVDSKLKKGTTISFTLPKKQPEISSERRCWEINRCKKIKCVAYNNRDLRCWLHVGVQCKKNSRAPCFDKIATCKYCKIYKNRFNK